MSRQTKESRDSSTKKPQGSTEQPKSETPQ